MPVSAPAWTLRTTTYGGISEAVGGEGVQPAFVDLDGDGTLEAFALTRDNQFAVLQQDGRPRWQRTFDYNVLALEALDVDGEPFTLTVEGLLARAVLHEHEHLDGKTFLGNVSPLKRELVKEHQAETA